MRKKIGQWWQWKRMCKRAVELEHQYRCKASDLGIFSIMYGIIRHDPYRVAQVKEAEFLRGCYKRAEKRARRILDGKRGFGS